MTITDETVCTKPFACMSRSNHRHKGREMEKNVNKNAMAFHIRWKQEVTFDFFSCTFFFLGLRGWHVWWLLLNTKLQTWVKLNKWRCERDISNIISATVKMQSCVSRYSPNEMKYYFSLANTCQSGTNCRLTFADA